MLVIIGIIGVAWLWYLVLTYRRPPHCFGEENHCPFHNKWPNPCQWAREHPESAMCIPYWMRMERLRNQIWREWKRNRLRTWHGKHR